MFNPWWHPWMRALTDILWEAPVVPWPQKKKKKKRVAQLVEIVVSPQSNPSMPLHDGKTHNFRSSLCQREDIPSHGCASSKKQECFSSPVHHVGSPAEGAAMLQGVDLPLSAGWGDIPGTLPHLVSVPMPHCLVSCAICLRTPCSAQLSASFSRKGLGALQDPYLQPGNPCIWQEAWAVLFRGSQTSTTPPHCKKGEALLLVLYPLVMSPALSCGSSGITGVCWGNLTFSYARKAFFFFPPPSLLAGIALCRFGELCYEGIQPSPELAGRKLCKKPCSGWSAVASSSKGSV